MLRSCYLFDESGDDRELITGRAPPALRQRLGLVLLIPRSLCLYLRLDARGVPLLRLRSFARLQLIAQSPIVKPEVFAARQGEILHLWLWEKDCLQAFSRRHGVPASRVEAMPSSAWTTAPPAGGAVLQRTPGSSGLHAQLWQDGRLQHDGWFESAPDAAAWRRWREDAARQHALQWPEAAPPEQEHDLPHRPWARNLLREHGFTVAADGGALAPLAPRLLAGATALSVACGIWLQAQASRFQHAIDGVQDAQADLSARLDPLQAAREAALQSQRWVVEAERLVTRTPATALLERIGSTLTAQGAVIREIDVQGDRVRVTVAPAVGELSLPELTQALTRTAGFHDVRFVDATSAQGLRFSWRLDGRDGLSEPIPAEAKRSRT